MGRFANLLTDVANRRAVRVQARQCREAGMTQNMLGQVLAGVIAYAALVTTDEPQEPTKQYASAWADNWLRSRMPGLDPATILLLIQLLWLIYQALKEIGYLDGEGLKSITPDAILEYLGDL
jgi:hypothetical protein